MKFVFSPDSLKGSLTAEQAAALLCRAAEEVFPGCDRLSLPMADGGEGTARAVAAARGGRRRAVSCRDPLMRPMEGEFFLLPDGNAVLDLATASGLTLLKEEERDPLAASTYGAGELFRAALDAGAGEIFIGLGGSATNDGGMGFLRALGARFTDGAGKELPGRGMDLETVERMDLTGFDPRVRQTKIHILSDVKNPLCGKDGAAYTFGPQKGASGRDPERLEKGMLRFRDLLIRQSFPDPDGLPGSGAAGGAGAALALVCGGEMASGADTVLDLLRFEDALSGAALVVTGEGRTDAQSAWGKAVSAVARRAKAAGVPVLVLSGSLGDGYETLYDLGADGFFAAVPSPMPLKEAMENAPDLYLDAARRLFRLLRTGRKLG